MGQIIMTSFMSNPSWLIKGLQFHIKIEIILIRPQLLDINSTSMKARMFHCVIDLMKRHFEGMSILYYFYYALTPNPKENAEKTKIILSPTNPSIRKSLTPKTCYCYKNDKNKQWNIFYYFILIKTVFRTFGPFGQGVSRA